MRLRWLLVGTFIVSACGQGLVVASPSQAASCDPRIDTGVIPDWAQAGFVGVNPSIAHKVGRAGEIAGLIFGNPLTSPPALDHNNKILWVARLSTAAERLDISAQRMDGALPIGQALTMAVQGGPGPSIIDLPQARSWRQTHTWANKSDSMDLEYVAGHA